MVRKTKLLCLGSLLLGFYFISNLLPFPGFIDEVFITALAFPFFSKKLKIRITLAVQGFWLLIWFKGIFVTFMKYADLIWLLASNFFEFGSFSGNSTISLLPDSVVNVSSEMVHGIGVLGQVVVVLQSLFPVEAFLVGLTYNVSMILIIVMVLSLWVIQLTVPYSIYIIMDKLGFYRLVERNTGGTITFKDPIDP